MEIMYLITHVIMLACVISILCLGLFPAEKNEKKNKKAADPITIDLKLSSDPRPHHFYERLTFEE